MKPTGICPDCEQHVEFAAMPTSPRLWKCNNCWHFLSDVQLAAAEKMSAELLKHEEQRNAIIAANR